MSKLIYLPNESECKIKEKREIIIAVSSKETYSLAKMIKAELMKRKYINDSFSIKEDCIYQFPKYPSNVIKKLKRYGYYYEHKNKHQKNDKKIIEVKDIIFNQEDIKKIALEKQIEYLIKLQKLPQDKLQAILYSRIEDKILFQKQIQFPKEERFINFTKELTEMILKKLNRQYGTLYIKTKPEKAMIFVNDVYYGRSPLKIEATPIGELTILAIKDGFLEAKKKLKIKNKETKEVLIELKPKVLKNINIISSKESEIYLDNRFLGIGKATTKIETKKPYRIYTKNNNKELYKTITTQKAKTIKLIPEKKIILNRNLLDKYYNYAIYSFWSSLICLTGGVYFDIKIWDIENQIALYGETESYKKDLELYKNLKNISFSLSGVFFITASYLFYKYLKVSDIEIAINQKEEKNSIYAYSLLFIGIKKTL